MLEMCKWPLSGAQLIPHAVVEHLYQVEDPHTQPNHIYHLVVLLFGFLALLLAPQNLSLLILNCLVNLRTPRRLVSVHLGRQRGIELAGKLLRGLLLPTALVRVVLVVGSGETVGYAALILW